MLKYLIKSLCDSESQNPLWTTTFTLDALVNYSTSKSLVTIIIIIIIPS